MRFRLPQQQEVQHQQQQQRCEGKGPHLQEENSGGRWPPSGRGGWAGRVWEWQQEEEKEEAAAPIDDAHRVHFPSPHAHFHSLGTSDGPFDERADDGRAPLRRLDRKAWECEDRWRRWPLRGEATRARVNSTADRCGTSKHHWCRCTYRKGRKERRKGNERSSLTS